MKILMVGTGVIGTLYAHALSKHHEITHFVRENKFNLMNKRTISYDVIDERENEENMYTIGEYTYKCVVSVECDYDLIIVPVNSCKLYEVLEILIKQAPNANYLLFTLNWDGTNEIDSMFKKEQYIMGYPGGGGTFKGNLLWGNIGQDVKLGAIYEEQKPLLNKMIKMFEECAIIPEIPTNILHALWMHNVGSGPIGVGLSKYNDIEKYLKDEKLVETCFKAMSECYSLCEKRGVNLSEFPEVEMYNMPFSALYPMFKNNFEENPIVQRFTAHALLAMDEMKDNFKKMLQLGDKMGIPMPNMHKLNNLI
ncbi:2-dehydropantoate 2-reductase N-terminal domain-containing protein [Bacillus sp. JKS001846]|uniref:ketopantoate reductase family protein n=1 Tax=Bacillus sp. JKS001846 TaxID=1938743 RepID=UPI0009D7BF73|nr:2-dehydropantoate 2-reductase N-terminal domain-containing protein [Bacillus sp. JKS001846]SMD41253.1 ketopantoate reductase [Bacillus sp. JKS001846]